MLHHAPPLSLQEYKWEGSIWLAVDVVFIALNCKVDSYKHEGRVLNMVTV